MPYLPYRAFQTVASPTLAPYRIKIIKSKPVGIYYERNSRPHTKKVSFLAQYLGFQTNFSIFDTKLRLTKNVQSLIFQKFYKDIENLISLGGTKLFNLKSHEGITHSLHSYRSDKQFYGGSASEALAQA